MIRFPFFGLAIALFALSGCATFQAKPPTATESFFERYSDLTGSAFAGKSLMVDLGENNPLENASLLMIPERYSEDEIRIRFFVNDDRSRTWIIRKTEDRLHFSHDHRYPNGTEHDQNLYGGYTDERGSSTLQFFPADERTIADRPSRAANVWSKEFDLQNSRYYYRLYLNGKLHYEAEFDLTETVEIPNGSIESLFID